MFVWLHCMLPGLALGLVPVPPLPVQFTLSCARSKCVPTKIEPGVVDEPVKNPFGLQTNRSSPINQPRERLLALDDPGGVPVVGGVPLRPSCAPSSTVPANRKVFGPTL